VPRATDAPWRYLAPPGSPEAGVWAGFALVHLQPGEEVALPGPGLETVVVPLRGGVTAGGIELAGRADVWAGATDVAYLPPGTPWRVRAGRTAADVAVGLAPAEATPATHPFRVPAAGVAIEHRGQGPTGREVRHLYEADRPAQHLLVVEVVTPPGHWSSFPPHRHDEPVALEEFYYCETEPATRRGYLHVFEDPAADGREATGPAPDEALAVRDGDLALVRRGYHTAASPPGTTLYYLNVMAGPDRAWTPVFHPAYRDLVVGWDRAPIAPASVPST